MTSAKKKERKESKKLAKRSKPVGETRRIVRLFVHYAGHRKVFVLASLMLGLEAVTSVFEPWPLAYLIDFLKGDKGALFGIDARYAVIAVLTGGIILLAAVNSLCDSLAEIYLSRGGRQLGYNLRVALYTHLEKLSLAFHSQRRTGDVLTRVTSDVTALEDFVVESVSDLAGSFLVLAGTLAFLGYKSPEVMLVGLVLVPLLAVVSNFFAKRIKAAAKRQRAREGDLASSAQEMLSSIGVIQTYGRGAYERERFAGHSQRAMDAALHAAKLEAWFSWAVSVLQAVCIGGIVWLGVYLVDRNASTVGDVVLYIILIQNMFKPTRKIIKEWNTVGKIYASVERINELLDREPSVKDEEGSFDAPPLEGRIDFDRVSFAYQLEPSADGDGMQPRLALDDLSFSIESGHMVALVGHSGAGKSTIAQLLPRLYDPHAGQVLLDGYDVRQFTIASLRGQISMVLQETVLFVGTVAENIAYGRPEATREEIIEAAIKSNADEFIQRLPEGYDTPLSERAANLSGGQRQRLAIARSFIRETPILILDEPTTGLDAESSQLVLDALHKLVEGKTSIVISHDLNLIRSADRILVMSQGHIVQQGTHESLLQEEGLYASLYNLQYGALGVEGVSPVAASPELVAVPMPNLDPEVAPGPVRRKAFETALMQALPLPASPEAFRMLLGPGQEPARQVELVGAGLPARVDEAAEPRDGNGRRGNGGPPGPEHPAHGGGGARIDEGPPIEPDGGLAAVAADDDAAGPPTREAAALDAVALAEPPGGQVAAPLPPVPLPPAAPAVPAGRSDWASPSVPAAAREMAPAPVALSDAALDPARIPAVLREVPGLTEALDGQAMAAHFAATLASGYEVLGCEVDKVLFVPGEGCILRYQLRVAEAATGRTIERLVSGRALPDSTACAAYRGRLAPLAERAAGRDELVVFAEPVASVESLRLVLHAFPIDADMPTLLPATDPRHMAEILGQTLPDAVDGRISVEACRVELVSYNRRGRCVLRYQVFGSNASDGQLSRQTIYGKVDSAGSGELARQVTQSLRERVAKSSGQRFMVPRVFGHVPDLSLALLEAVPGSPRVGQLARARVAEPAAGAAGGLTLEAALTACAHIAGTLHGSGIRLGRPRTLEGEIAAVRQELIGVGRLCPALGVRLARQLARAENAATETDPLPFGLTHGDYTPAQVLFDEQRSGLIDFDTACQAEGALDVGSFIAYLRVALRKAERQADRAPNGLGDELASVFLRAWASETGTNDLESLSARAAAFESVSLVRMALRSWQKLKLARLNDILSVIDERTAAQASRQRFGSGEGLRP